VVSPREIPLFDSLSDGFGQQISIPNEGVENRCHSCSPRSA
jgi:hypothetical protein